MLATRASLSAAPKVALTDVVVLETKARLVPRVIDQLDAEVKEKFRHEASTRS